jgi:spore photoproduct lyase
VLQSYLDRPVITLNVRLPDMLDEIGGLMRGQPRRFFRFGTGELGDSLALDPFTGLSETFIDFFKDKRNALIELKTKSVQIERLFGTGPGNTVVSWSVNPESVIQREELHAPSLEARLHAAKKCRDAGYLLGFHFDPILHIENWESSYREVVDRIFSTIDANRVAWISLGSLRFPPALKPVIQSRFPGSRIVYEEMIRGLDGKMRYLKPLRIALYRHIYRRIRSHSPDVFVYFCMESPQIWEQVTGTHPGNNAELDYWFAESLWRRFRNELIMDKPRLEDYPEET